MTTQDVDRPDVDRPDFDRPDFDHPDVVLCPDGPMLLRGVESVQDADGTVHRVHRPVVALCRCEKSSRLPWCDGTHKVIPRS